MIRTVQWGIQHSDDMSRASLDIGWVSNTLGRGSEVWSAGREHGVQASVALGH